MIGIREMQVSDLPSVLPLEQANFSLPWDERGFLAYLGKPDAVFLVAEEDQRILGYCGTLISFEDAEITNVCVASEARGRGVGRRLMEELIGRCQEKGVEFVHLEVRESNTPARTMYDHMGFTVDFIRKGYYDLPKEDAVMMTWKKEA